MNKYVITGGPSVGKTTVIEELKRRGHNVLGETARQVIIEKNDFTPNELELEICRRQIKNERNLNGESVFLDRGLPDVCAYCRYYDFKLPVREILALWESQARENFSYAGIFILEQLPFKKDGVRIEKNEKEARLIHQLVTDTYSSFGYNPIFVPVMPVRERADYILKWTGNGLKRVKHQLNKSIDDLLDPRDRPPLDD